MRAGPVRLITDHRHAVLIMKIKVKYFIRSKPCCGSVQRIQPGFCLDNRVIHHIILQHATPLPVIYNPCPGKQFYAVPNWHLPVVNTLFR